jgi:hypothetical protein
VTTTTRNVEFVRGDAWVPVATQQLDVDKLPNVGTVVVIDGKRLVVHWHRYEPSGRLFMGVDDEKTGAPS